MVGRKGCLPGQVANCPRSAGDIRCAEDEIDAFGARGAGRELQVVMMEKVNEVGCGQEVVEGTVGKIAVGVNHHDDFVAVGCVCGDFGGKINEDLFFWLGSNDSSTVENSKLLEVGRLHPESVGGILADSVNSVDDQATVMGPFEVLDSPASHSYVDFVFMLKSGSNVV